MRSRVVASGLAAVGLLVGCAGAGGARREDGPAPLRVASPTAEVLVGEHSVVGRTSDLVVKDGELRGRFRTLPVDLSWNGQYLTGVINGQPTRLELAEGDDVQLQGTFAGEPMNVVVEKGGLSGKVGGCTYALFRVHGGFRGPRVCHGNVQTVVELQYPEAMAQKPLGQQAALLALMLSPLYRPTASILGGHRALVWTIADPEPNPGRQYSLRERSAGVIQR